MLNKVILMGRLTVQPELRHTESGISFLSFSIAVDRSYTDRDGNRATDFFNCKAWRNTAEFIAKYFSKGQMIVVDGSLENHKYVDKEGNNRQFTDVKVQEVFFASKKSDNQNSDAYPASINADGAEFSDMEDGDEDGDLPF